MLTLISVVIPVTVGLVVAAVARVMWRARTSARDAAAVVAATVTLAAWAGAVALLAWRGAFAGVVVGHVPPLGVALGAGLIVMAGALATSRSLRRLLGSQADLTHLHLWRLLGAAFVLMWIVNRLPALFALPAGLGDIAIGVTAPWMAREAGRISARRLSVWHGLGLADLVMAVSLGVMTNPGGLQVFETVPTSEALTTFPLALIPGFLVPLAMTLHGVSLTRLLQDSRLAFGLRATARQAEL